MKMMHGRVLREGTEWKQEGQWPTFINLSVDLPRVLLIYVASHRDASTEHILALGVGEGGRSWGEELEDSAAH